MFELDAEIRAWRAVLSASGSFVFSDIEELESHLRDSVDALLSQGLSTEEAFLVAIKRLGDVSAVNEEFAKVSTADVWRQLLVPADTAGTRTRNRREFLLVVALALFAGLLGKIPALFGFSDIEGSGLVYPKNAAVFALLPVTFYLMYKRSFPIIRSLAVIGFFAVYVLLANLYPSMDPHHTAQLSAMHAPIVLLYLLMYVHGGPDVSGRTRRGGWRHPNNRLNFVRFAGESFLFAVLIGLGGLVLMGITMGTFELIGIDASGFALAWMAPVGFFGLFPVAAYLVEQKRSLIESIAPVLARIFTPLFIPVVTSLVIAFMLVPSTQIDSRMLLIWIDLMLALVLGLTVYSISAKDYGRKEGPSVWDWCTVVLLGAAIILDLLALTWILARLSSHGLTPNKIAALGENLLLLVNLVLLFARYVGYCGNKRPFQEIVILQMRFLDAYAIWATVIVVFFPVVFSFR